MHYPGKGVHIALNEQYRSFLADALNDIGQCYDDDVHDADPKAVINALMTDDEDITLGLSWIEEKDNFGHKVYAMTPYKKGKLRVTVVLTKQNELRLDIREWFEPES